MRLISVALETKKKTRLLVVDDAPYVLKALRDILEASGYEVYEAIDGEVALARYVEVRPDVVLMDVLMPKLDGVSATRMIVKNDPSARIIIISAVGKVGLEEECLKAGAKKFVVKPFKIRGLLGSINSLVEE